jgi:hypothetical protein
MIKMSCGCKPTNEGTALYPREMLLPHNMCEEHHHLYQTTHAASVAERAQARAALEAAAGRADWDDVA